MSKTCFNSERLSYNRHGGRTQFSSIGNQELSGRPLHDTSGPGFKDICAKLMTIREGRKEAIVVSLSRPAIIGRNPNKCSYVVDDVLVSGIHCKLYAVQSPSGGIIISCQDVSRNGMTLNGQNIRKTSIILMDGDVIRLPNSLAFTCVHLWKKTPDKLTLFEPTPPLQPAHKPIGRYVVTSQCLGTGSFATVHLALDPTKHRQVACKSIRAKRDHDVGQVMKEVRILMTLKHPNINEIYDTEEDQKFMSVSLSLIFYRSLGLGNIDANHEATFFFNSVLAGIFSPISSMRLGQAVESKMISHRDLKPENILLYCPGAYPRILIADFGLARPNSYQETFNVCGTVSYLPPEGILALDNKHLGYIGYTFLTSQRYIVSALILDAFPEECRLTAGAQG
ncbi:kinase-like domain-containing protein [Crassisporium funariophilum]|nr:kinase-like domain-containing protein [Crassisporium funariophilum]